MGNNIKTFFKSIGKAAAYFSLYMVMQLVISFMLALILSIVLSANALLDVSQSMTLYQDKYIQYSTVVTLLSNLISLILVGILFKIRKRSFFAEIKAFKCNPRLLIVSILFGISSIYGINILVGFIPFPDSIMQSFFESHSALSEENSIINFISVVLIAPVVEEVFFRGLVYTRLREGMATIAAAIISSVLFAIAHGELIWMVIAFMFGLDLVLVFEKTRTLWSCILLHIVNNSISQLTYGFNEVSGSVGIMLILTSAVTSIICFMYIIKKHSVNLK